MSLLIHPTACESAAGYGRRAVTSDKGSTISDHRCDKAADKPAVFMFYIIFFAPVWLTRFCHIAIGFFNLCNVSKSINKNIFIFKSGPMSESCH